MARSVDNHKPGCACPACTNRGKGETEVFRFRLRPSLAAWLREQGGAEYLRALLEREMAREQP
jgi:hypothetical protein